MGNTILKTTEGFQVTSVHKPPASLLPYHSFIYTDCQEKSLVSLRQTTLFIFYLLVFKSTTFRSFASCHSCNICSCHCILSMACRDQSCEADLLPPHPSHFPPQWPAQEFWMAASNTQVTCTVHF